MTQDLMKFAAAPALALSLLAAPAAMAAGQHGWDRDGDGVSQGEFHENFAGNDGVFDDWDQDHDEQISREEFSARFFEYYDRDNDGVLNAEESGMMDDDMNEEGGLFDM